MPAAVLGDQLAEPARVEGVDNIDVGTQRGLPPGSDDGVETLALTLVLLLLSIGLVHAKK